MKVAQNDEMIPDTQPVRPPHPLTYQTRNFPPLAPLPENTEPREYFPDASPFTGTTSYRVRVHLTSRFVMSCIVMHLFALYLLFLPPLLSLDIECWGT